MALGRQAASILYLGVAVTLEVDFHALGDQTLAALTTTAGKDGTAIFGFAASTESELLLPCSLRWLVGPFGHRRGFGLKVADCRDK